MNVLSSRSETRQRCPFLPVQCTNYAEFLYIAIKQEKEVKVTHIGKEEVKMCLLVDYMIVYIENPKNKTYKK